MYLLSSSLSTVLSFPFSFFFLSSSFHLHFLTLDLIFSFTFFSPIFTFLRFLLSFPFSLLTSHVFSPILTSPFLRPLPYSFYLFFYYFSFLFVSCLLFFYFIFYFPLFIPLLILPYLPCLLSSISPLPLHLLPSPILSLTGHQKGSREEWICAVFIFPRI